jgi:hypothetical protein
MECYVSLTCKFSVDSTNFVWWNVFKKFLTVRFSKLISFNFSVGSSDLVWLNILKKYGTLGSSLNLISVFRVQTIYIYVYIYI